MTTVRRPKGRKRAEDPEGDFQAMRLAAKPNQTMRIMGLLALGHRLDKIVAVGVYTKAWTRRDVMEALRLNRVTPPAAPFGGGSAPHAAAPSLVLPPQGLLVLGEACRGFTPQTIAERTGLREAVVTALIADMCRQVNARDRCHLVCLVLRGEIRPLKES